MDTFRILIVDDNPQIHEDFKSVLLKFEETQDEQELDALFTKITTPGRTANAAVSSPLESVKYSVDSAFQGQEALAFLKKATHDDQPYAIAFVDMRMPPGWDGITTIEKLWRVDPRLQVVICSAYSDLTWEVIFEKLRPKDNLLILKKPFDASEIQQMTFTLTEKWRISKDLEKSRKGLEEAKEALEKTVSIQQMTMIESARLAQLGEMAGGIAHEINNPIGIIKLRAVQAKRLLMNAPPQVSRVGEFLDIIDDTSERIAKIVSGLLHFARGTTGEEKSSYQLLTIVNATLDLCAEKFRINEINIEVNVPSELYVQCKATQISQVFLNLLNNSYDAVLALKERWVRIEAKQVNQHVFVNVIDSGSRIPDELARKIMQPFFTTKPIGKGTGLGLSISHGLVRDSDGILELDMTHSNMCFRIRLDADEVKKSVA